MPGGLTSFMMKKGASRQQAKDERVKKRRPEVKRGEIF
jgi:hypothetical protein